MSQRSHDSVNNKLISGKICEKKVYFPYQTVGILYSIRFKFKARVGGKNVFNMPRKDVSPSRE